MKNSKKALICFGAWMGFGVFAYLCNLIEYAIEYALNFLVSASQPIPPEMGFGGYCFVVLLTSPLVVCFAVTGWEVWEDQQERNQEEWEAEEEWQAEKEQQVEEEAKRKWEDKKERQRKRDAKIFG